MAEPVVDSVKDAFRVNGVQLSKTFTINRPTRKLNTTCEMKIYTGEFYQNESKTKKKGCSDVNGNERVPAQGSSDDKD
jgi:hypothetical protein